jgi:hypothetical protein
MYKRLVDGYGRAATTAACQRVEEFKEILQSAIVTPDMAIIIP